METGKLVFQPGIVNVETLIGGATADLNGQRNGNSFCVDIDPALGIMVGDESKIKRCLRNLVSNAFKFTKDGEVSLRVRLAGEAGAEKVCFAVADTGIGMTADQIAHVFDPFTQGDTSMARQFGGSGLGLAVTRRLVSMMCGQVGIESVANEGSTFTITLPRNLAHAPDRGPAHGYSENAPDEETDGATIDKIALVINDDQTAVALMRRRLAAHGYGVIAAPDGETGLSLARSEQPDIIVLDIHMPGKNGYQLLEAIRADETIAATPVIVATVDDDRLRGLRSGATEYLTKPVAPQQLADVLNLYRDRVDGEILIVDDDPDAGDLVARTAAEVGLRSRRAFDGLQALTMIREARPSAIVLDLTLPGMSGFTLLEMLRGNPALREIRSSSFPGGLDHGRA